MLQVTIVNLHGQAYKSTELGLVLGMFVEIFVFFLKFSEGVLADKYQSSYDC